MRRAAQLLLALLVMVVAAGFTPLPDRQAPPGQGDTVILLHGIFNRPFIMTRIAWTLKQEGYQVVNWSYPSRDHTIEEHAAALDRLVQTVNHGQRIHFVGFSLGSIVARYYLTHYELPNAGRFVMIAPPNHGTEKADRLYPYWWFRALYGTTSIQQLQAGNRGYFEQLGEPAVEFGIIAGGRGNESGLSRWLPGDDDGAVSVSSAKLDGAADFILLRHQHTTLLWTQAANRHVAAFLESGRFDHQLETAR